MPTSRALTFVLTALLLYFFANQIQVGWIYVMAALMAGVVLAAWWSGRGALKGIRADRLISPGGPPREGETVSVRLAFHNTRSDSHVRATERCPLAEPGSAAAALPVFIPALPRQAPVELAYDVVADRRGLHEFPALQMETPAPFGLFRRRRLLPAPTRVLVYPEVRPLRRLALFDRQPTAALAQPRPGFGAEVIGVRPYRPGDSPRHIHWRSTARTGQLISKEFSDDSQPGLSLVLDLFQHPGSIQKPNAPVQNPKHTPFEWSVKIAASIGDFALRRGYSLHLLADEAALPPPTGPLAEIALLEYLARVQPTGRVRLPDVFVNRPARAFAAILLPWPDDSVVEPLVELKRRGVSLLAVVLDPASFPAGGPSGRALAGALDGAGIDSRLIQFGSDWLGQFDPESRPAAGE